ncbi:ribonuclease H-like domain-containing protein [Tanacetum coccineum]
MAIKDTPPPTPPPSNTDKLIPFSIANKVPIKLNLEKHNYNFWSSFFIIHLGSLGLKSHVEEDTSSTNPEWCKLDDLIKMWILGSLCESLQEQVVATTGNAKALWDHLKDLFHDNKDARAINLNNELRSIKIGKMTVNEYCTKIKSMADRLKNLGCVVSEKNLVIYTVNGIDLCFATLVKIIRHRETLPTFEITRNVLLLKESSFNDQVGESTTFESSSSSLTILLASSLSDNKAIIRTVLSPVSRKWPIHQLDVKNDFLNGDLSETLYMHQPPGFVDSRYPNHVCHLQRSLYELKQAHRSQFAYLLLYADDIILTPSFIALLQHLMDSLHRLFLSQRMYALQLLERAHMLNCNPSRTLVDTESKRDPNWVLGTLDFGLHLYASSTTSLVGYTDADWAGCPSTCKSTSAETAWIRNLLRELCSPLSTVTLVYCDNFSAIYMSINPVQHQQTKHIEIDIHFVRDMVTAGQVRVLHVPSCFQYAGIFTKGLPLALFEDFRSSLSVRPPPAPTAWEY